MGRLPAYPDFEQYRPTRGWKTNVSINTPEGIYLTGKLRSGEVGIDDTPSEIWHAHPFLRVFLPVGASATWRKFIGNCKKAVEAEDNNNNKKSSSKNNNTMPPADDCPSVASDSSESDDDGSINQQTERMPSYKPNDPPPNGSKVIPRMLVSTAELNQRDQSTHPRARLVYPAHAEGVLIIMDTVAGTQLQEVDIWRNRDRHNKIHVNAPSKLKNEVDIRRALCESCPVPLLENDAMVLAAEKAYIGYNGARYEDDRQPPPVSTTTIDVKFEVEAEVSNWPSASDENGNIATVPGAFASNDGCHLFLWFAKKDGKKGKISKVTLSPTRPTTAPTANAAAAGGGAPPGGGGAGAPNFPFPPGGGGW